MGYTVQVESELSPIDKESYKQAKEVVGRLESRFPGDPIRVNSEILKSKPEIGAHPTADQIKAIRVMELARLYHYVSDGNGGIDPKASSSAKQALQEGLAGRSTHGGLLASQQLAMHRQDESLMSSNTKNHFIKNKNIFVGLGLAGVSALAAAAEPDATPAKVFDAAASTAVPGWMEARRGEMCKAFGEVARGIAAAPLPAVTGGLTVTASVASGPFAPAVAAVGSVATVKAAEYAYEKTAPVAQTSETACNAVTNATRTVIQKLGF